MQKHFNVLFSALEFRPFVFTAKKQKSPNRKGLPEFSAYSAGSHAKGVAPILPHFASLKSQNYLRMERVARTGTTRKAGRAAHGLRVHGL